eukprot:SAG31_NODE_37530_length_303_cov_1.009804_1_plen_36_part_01
MYVKEMLRPEVRALSQLDHTLLLVLAAAAAAAAAAA